MFVTGAGRAIGRDFVDADWQAIAIGCQGGIIEKTPTVAGECGRAVQAFEARSPKIRRVSDGGSISANTARLDFALCAGTNHDITGLPFVGRG